MAVPDLSQAAATGRTLPSWVLSALLHLVLILLLGWLLHTAPRGAADEPGRMVGIVLKHASDQTEYYEGEDDQAQDSQQATDANQTVETEQSADLSQALPQNVARLDPTDALPAGQAAIGAGALEEGLGDAGALTAGASQPRSVSGGKARVGIFGVEGEGSKFVYVFDRSISMFGAPLDAAKQQLLASLDSLESTHQFQIIFFNHDCRVFDLSGGQNRIPFATDRTKELARKFVGGITADGATDRYAALMKAVAMRPDVVFFLTDTDDPMSPGELERIRRKNRGATAIFAIEFGVGPQVGGNNFLMKLARDNGGSFVYVDTAKLRR